MSEASGHTHERGEDYAHAESDHLENTGSGILRATVFGVSDGLVSNLALVMGVAGGSQNPDAIVLAGSAGLLAGAFSMAAGEYVSMRTQRETMERQLRLEREHILNYPEEEQAHLTELLVQHCFSRELAIQMAHGIHQHPDPAVDFHALLELGIVPRQMGSPVEAAGASFVSFVAGALIPLLPWFFTDHGLVPSMFASALALLAVGGAVTRYTHVNAWLGALRQLAFGAGAAGATYWIGRLIGAAI